MNQYFHTAYQGTNARKVNCDRVYFAYILKPVLSGGICKQERCISVRLVSEEVNAFNFDNFENSHISFL